MQQQTTMGRSSLSLKVISVILLLAASTAAFFIIPRTIKESNVDELGGIFALPLGILSSLGLVFVLIFAIISIIKNSKYVSLSLSASFILGLIDASVAFEYANVSNFALLPVVILYFSICFVYVINGSKNHRQVKYIVLSIAMLLVSILSLVTLKNTIVDQKNDIIEKERVNNVMINASKYSDCDVLLNIYAVEECAQKVLNRTDDLVGCVQYSAGSYKRLKSKAFSKSGYFYCWYKGTFGSMNGGAYKHLYSGTWYFDGTWALKLNELEDAKKQMDTVWQQAYMRNN